MNRPEAAIQDSAHLAADLLVWDRLWLCVRPLLSKRQEMLQVLVQVLCQELDAAYSAVYEVVEGSDLDLAAACGVGGPGQDWAVQAVAKSVPCLHESGSFLAVPLSVETETGEQVMGVLSLGRGAERAFDPGELELCCAVAGRVAWLVCSAVQLERMEREMRSAEQVAWEREAQLEVERDRADFLYQIAQEMRHTLDLDRVLNRTLFRIGRTLGVRQASILVLDADSGDLFYRAALGRPLSLPKGGKRTRFRRGVGLAGWVLEHNQSALIADLDNDPRWHPDPEKLGQSQSAMAVPLSTESEALGVILLFHPQRDYFNEGKLWLVTAAAYLLTAACRNYELYRLVREQAARLGQMLRSQRSIAAQRMAILSSLADGVAVLDEKGRVSLINATVTRIMRPTTLALEGQPWEALLGGFSDQALDAVREMMDNLRSGEGTRADPLSTVVGRDEQSVLVTVAPMVDEHLHFEGTVFVFRDVTAEQEIAQAKTDFVSTVAHELRTPMTSIKGYTDLLLKGAAGPINDEQVRFLDIVKSNVSRMADLVADLLDISRIEAGRASLEPKPLDLGGVLAEVRDSVIETVHARDLSFSLDAAPGLPRVVADRSRLIQILNNLVSNAYRYTPPGGEIRVSARRVSNMVQIDVQDTGIGIAPQDQERIFERFYRANHPMVNRQAGTGLGLPIVRSLVELHGGRLWLNSELEKGSVFSFTLLVANR